MYIPIFHWEQMMHGRDEEMQTLFKSMVENVISRLLRSLETGGNEIQPRLLHGDLWDGNSGADADTEEPFIFNATSFYGDNEYDLGPWNLPRHKVHKAYIREYQRHFRRSDPKEDFEDRLLLYRHRFELSALGCFPNLLMCRELTAPDMRYLVEKYFNGYEGPHSRKSER